MRIGYVYIITNKNRTVLYTGVTSNLRQRLEDHINKKYPNSFSAKYQLNTLLYFEVFHTITQAIVREKQIKAGSRDAKVKLIASVNPEWAHLEVGF